MSLSKPKTIQVRIAIAVTMDGEWNAAGWDGASPTEQKHAAQEPFDYGTPLVVHWVTAELPVPVMPESIEVKGMRDSGVKQVQDSSTAVYRLCYIDDNWAYFTTKEPFNSQWGDNWNEAPYEHNASRPSKWLPDRKTPPYEIKRIIWSGDYMDPAGACYRADSSLTVEQINNRVCPWLIPAPWNRNPHARSIPAGTPLDEFIEIIEQSGGEIYVKKNEES